MQYLSYNANKWLQQSLDLKAMVGSIGAANALIDKGFALIISIYTATNDVTFIVFQNFTNI